MANDNQAQWRSRLCPFTDGCEKGRETGSVEDGMNGLQELQRSVAFL
jgi:hypothetical protein